MVFLHQNVLLVIAFFVLLVFLILEERTGVNSNVRLSPQAAVDLINRQHARVLDVRDKSDFNSGHIPGSIHLPLVDFSVNHQLIRSKKDKVLIVLAAKSKEDLDIFSKLKKAGFSQVYMLKGGLVAWNDAQMPLIKK